MSIVNYPEIFSFGVVHVSCLFLSIGRALCAHGGLCLCRDMTAAPIRLSSRHNSLDEVYSTFSRSSYDGLWSASCLHPCAIPLSFFACRSLIVQQFVKRFLILSNSCSCSFISCSLSFRVSLSSILPAYFANDRGFRFVISYSF